MLKRIATITFLLFAVSILSSVFAATSQSNVTSGTQAGYGAGSTSDTKSAVSGKCPTTDKKATAKAPTKYKKSTTKSKSRAATMGKGPSTKKQYKSYTTKRGGVTYKCYPVRKHRASTPAKKAAGPQPVQKKTSEYCPKL